ncbi:MAG TPA: enoyl-CoA hydratase-related protein [Solirubrobacteraceae bacterium]|jgi:enoyl-CoA hydratase/carnithine racemase
MIESNQDVLLYELRDQVAWLTLNRPQARNALNEALREALREAFARFGADPEARVAVLRGAGPSFCAGADLKEMAASELRIPPAGWIPHLQREASIDKPVIAAVQGSALAGGFLLAQMADLCVAAEDAQFGITEARWGRGAPWAAPLVSMMPARVALELLIVAQPISARRAYELGLVNRVVPAAELDAAAAELAATIVANAPLSVAAGKQMVHEVVGLPLEQAFALADELYAPAYLSEDAQEGPRAFNERRAPRWQGR